MTESALRAFPDADSVSSEDVAEEIKSVSFDRKDLSVRLEAEFQPKKMLFEILGKGFQFALGISTELDCDNIVKIAEVTADAEHLFCDMVEFGQVHIGKHRTDGVADWDADGVTVDNALNQPQRSRILYLCGEALFQRVMVDGLVELANVILADVAWNIERNGLEKAFDTHHSVMRSSVRYGCKHIADERLFKPSAKSSQDGVLDNGILMLR